MHEIKRSNEKKISVTFFCSSRKLQVLPIIAKKAADRALDFTVSMTLHMVIDN